MLERGDVKTMRTAIDLRRARQAILLTSGGQPFKFFKHTHGWRFLKQPFDKVIIILPSGHCWKTNTQ
jgi:hypothetical protein